MDGPRNPGEEVRPVDQDKAWAEAFTANAETKGFVVYCGSFEDKGVGDPERCYALVMLETELVSILDDLGFQGKLPSESYWEGKMLRERKATTLPWEVMIVHPRIKKGATRQEAILASLQAGYQESGTQQPGARKPGWLKPKGTN